MRDPYLLAAGLLTGLAIPASALPHLSIVLPESSRFLWDLKQGSQTIVSTKIIPSVDLSLPELSGQAFQPLKSSRPIVSEKNVPSVPEFSSQALPVSTESSLNPSTQATSLLLTSGNQLYYQRLAALKTGQIYTRVDSDNLQSLWESIKKRQLTYDDWKSLLALEARAIAQGQGANHLSILVGDSLSMWFPREKLPAGKLWLNQGISGDTSTGVLKRLGAFSATRPDVIYIMAGINDLRKGASDETILHNYRRIVRRLRQTHPKAQIIVQSILPTRLPKISNSRIRHLNIQLTVIAKQEGANYLNIYSWFTDMEGNLRPELTTDGLHLSQEGYDVWRTALQQIEYKLTQREN
ncbi:MULTISPECIES: SGNH/GDSL hydrolase family protein [unclassified Nostoc]|uniref:G-D-S-L family lipolytic protein n=1 Tax=Nostoc punctiforme NIES-2108 TaxID=1356359 RepID=A0A367RYQ8_NOSPU|nr:MULTISPECIES: SGNH/GDSL hydrolase family protein [unclassified Nostoc]MBN3876317.1 G-D-S-L family lipolytic protein [Nostoc sp. JL23]MBN3892990.1 G-D-S-L family lipolytic protein [Nostoc sp. JL31]RCJ41678.1 G-D-S-L family lipolytic protein [Nostoc punctiforme NIES-2108]